MPKNWKRSTWTDKRCSRSIPILQPVLWSSSNFSYRHSGSNSGIYPWYKHDNANPSSMEFSLLFRRFMLLYCISYTNNQWPIGKFPWIVVHDPFTSDFWGHFLQRQRYNAVGLDDDFPLLFLSLSQKTRMVFSIAVWIIFCCHIQHSNVRFALTGFSSYFSFHIKT